MWLVPDKKEFIIFILLCLIALDLSYWYGMPDKPSEERAEAGTPPAPTVVTNVVKEVVTNIVAATPQPTPTPTPAPVKPRPQPTPTNLVPNSPAAKAAIRKAAGKPTGELTKADYEKVTHLYFLFGEQGLLAEIPKELEKLTQLMKLSLNDNQLTNVKGLEKLTHLKSLNLSRNPDLTKAQIATLRKALPNCKISSNPTK